MIGIAGAGAFGTALAVALAADGHRVRLWARDAGAVASMKVSRMHVRLPGLTLPDGVEPVREAGALADAGAVLVAVPTQALGAFLAAHGPLLGHAPLVLCCKGVELGSGRLPSEVAAAVCPGAEVAVLSGPGFADEIARGRPTALTLATDDPARGVALQAQLSTAGLRLYTSTDVPGAQIGGAVKNVIAIACGIVIGAGLGESARAATMTRGFAEMRRLARRRGARDETLMGLSGLGDLALTCTSERSRNFAHGLALGAGRSTPAGVTVEGQATARALAAGDGGIDLPISTMVASVIDGRLGVAEAVARLLARPLRGEAEAGAGTGGP